MSASDSMATVLAPFGSAPRQKQRLAGTGTTEATNATGLSVGQAATLKVGSAAIRVNWGSATAPGCATTDTVFGPYDRYDWLVEPGCAYVSIEAADGSSAYEAHVWTSSPGL